MSRPSRFLQNQCPPRVCKTCIAPTGSRFHSRCVKTALAPSSGPTDHMARPSYNGYKMRLWNPHRIVAMHQAASQCLDLGSLRLLSAALHADHENHDRGDDAVVAEVLPAPPFEDC